MLQMIRISLTKPQTGHSAQITPGQRREGAPVLHFSEVEDEGNTGDEDKVKEAHGGKKVGNLSKIGTAYEHLK